MAKFKKIPLDQQVMLLRTELLATREVLGTLISWIATSSNSPIRQDEAIKLLNRLPKMK